MSFFIKSKLCELPSIGMHNAVCVQIVDLGTHTDSKYKVTRRELMIMFELEERNSQEQRFTTIAFCSHSLDPKSNLRKHLESWKGSMSDKTAFDYDLETLLREGAFLNVQETESGKRKIVSISPLPNNIEKLTPEGNVLSFSIDEYPENSEIFEELSDYAKQKIEASEEFKKKGIED